MADTLYLIGGGASSGGGGSGGATPYPNFAAIPAGTTAGDMAITTDNGVVYWWDGFVWEPIDTELASVAVSDTNSIDHTITGGVLSSDLKLSSNSATAGFFKSTTTVQSSGSVGLHVETPEATGSQTGVLKSADWTTFNNKVSTSRTINTTAPITGGGNLSSDLTIAMPVATSSTDGYLDNADWTTFNNKEPSITSGTTTQYWRGDKSFQTLNVAALSAVVDGSSASTGAIGEILSGSQATNTTTGVGASGAWGSVTSVSLTAGVWAISATAGFNENGATLTDFFAGGISDSATGVGISEFDTVQHAYTISGSGDSILAVPQKYISISTTTTYHLNSKFNYSSGTPRHRGNIKAIRIR